MPPVHNPSPMLVLKAPLWFWVPSLPFLLHYCYIIKNITSKTAARLSLKDIVMSMFLTVPSLLAVCLIILMLVWSHHLKKEKNRTEFFPSQRIISELPFSTRNLRKSSFLENHLGTEKWHFWITSQQHLEITFFNVANGISIAANDSTY